MMNFSYFCVKCPDHFVPELYYDEMSEPKLNSVILFVNGGKIIGNQSPNLLIAVISLKQFNFSVKLWVSCLANDDNENFVLFCLVVEG